MSTNTILKGSLISTLFNVLNIFSRASLGATQAAIYGTGRDMDVFVVSCTVPLFLMTVMTGAIGATYLPEIASLKASNDKKSSDHIIAQLDFCLVAFVIAIVAMTSATSPLWIDYLAHGFTLGEKTDLDWCLKFLVWQIAFAAISEVLAQKFYAMHKFLWPAIGTSIVPLFACMNLLIFGSEYKLKALVYGNLFAYAAQPLILAVGLWLSSDSKFKLTPGFRHKSIRTVFSSLAWLMSGMLVYRITPLYDRWLASFLPSGSVSSLNYSFRFYEMIQTMFVSGLATALFPVLSNKAASNDNKALATNALKAVKILLFIVTPLALTLIFFGRPLIQLYFERGAFRNKDTDTVFSLLQFYLPNIPFAISVHVMAIVFYATKKTKLITILGVIETFFYLAVGYPLMKFFGLNGIALSYCTLIMWTFFMNLSFMGRTIQIPLITPVLKSIAMNTSACFIMFILAIIRYSDTRTSYLLDILFAVVSLGGYVAIQKYLLRPEELQTISNTFKTLTRSVRSKFAN